MIALKIAAALVAGFVLAIVAIVALVWYALRAMVCGSWRRGPEPAPRWTPDNPSPVAPPPFPARRWSRDR